MAGGEDIVGCNCRGRKARPKPELNIGSPCVASPGVHHNVNVEVDEHCRVVRIWEAEKKIIKGCDECG